MVNFYIKKQNKVLSIIKTLNYLLIVIDYLLTTFEPRILNGILNG